MVRHCDQCQRFAKTPRAPADELHIMASPWPFAIWGLNLLGPFPIVVGRKKFVVVTCDYFTKWVEADALPAITQEAIEKFIWQSIICRFGVPHVIINDNDIQLQSKSC